MSGPIALARVRLYTATCRSTKHAIRSFTSTSSIARQAGQTNDPKGSTPVPNVSETNEVAVDNMGVGDKPLQESVQDGERRRELQAPNRSTVWSRNQNPRELAMSGPRFEQTIMEVQPRPYAAVELIHKQPVRWVDQKAVACDGGGGPLGHPRIFINVDKPQICWCTYCGLPYAHKHHRKLLESIPKDQLTYPLEPSNDPAQVVMPNTPTQKGEIQGQYPELKGALNADSIDEQPFTQR